MSARLAAKLHLAGLKKSLNTRSKERQDNLLGRPSEKSLNSIQIMMPRQGDLPSAKSDITIPA